MSDTKRENLAVLEALSRSDKAWAGYQAKLRLEAAAPKLLAACQMMDRCHGSTPHALARLSTREREALQSIREAIVDATLEKPDE